MSRRTSTSSRVATSMSGSGARTGCGPRVSTSRRTPWAAPAASVARRASSSKSRLDGWAMALNSGEPTGCMAPDATDGRIRRETATGLTSPRPAGPMAARSIKAPSSPSPFPPSTRSRSPSGRSRSAGTRWPTWPASSAAGSMPRRLAARADALGRPAPPEPRPTSTTSSSGWRSASCSAGGIGYVLFYNLGSYLARPAGDPRGLARRHVVPRRLPRRDPGASCSSPAARGLNPLAAARPGRGGDADRPVLRPHRQFRQRRALGPRRARLSLRGGLPAGGPRAAPSEPALRGLRRGPAAVRRHGASPSGASASAGRAFSAASSSSATRSRASSASSSASPTRSSASCSARRSGCSAAASPWACCSRSRWRWSAPASSSWRRAAIPDPGDARSAAPSCCCGQCPANCCS